MKILITGSNSFIARNLIHSLKHFKDIEIFKFSKSTSIKKLYSYLLISDFLIHCAAVSRPKNKLDYMKVNFGLTEVIGNFILKNNLSLKIIFLSSIKVSNNSLYGKSKKKSEDFLKMVYTKNKNKIYILRLPNVFGKWGKPNYNSVVATFCYLVSRKKKLTLKNKNKSFPLLYIDDLIKVFHELLFDNIYKKNFVVINNFQIFNTTPNELSKLINLFYINRKYNFIPNTSDLFIKYLYSTYISYVPKKQITYNLKSNTDMRGNFVEFLKFSNNGQVSYCTINPKQIRGPHYHNTKIEKFIVLQGTVIFTFQNIDTLKKYVFKLSEKSTEVIETIPGYTHQIENKISKKAIILVWTNEIFDRKNQDTYLQSII